MTHPLAITPLTDLTTDEDVLVRSEAAKHRAAVAQVLTWIAMALSWSVAGVLILQRLGPGRGRRAAAGGRTDRDGRGPP